MNVNERLHEEVRICRIHADRLNMALEEITHIYPFSADKVTNIPKADLAYLDMFTTRLGKLQDTVGEKVFPLILEALGEQTESKSYIDRLNKLEKLEILPDVTWWQELRKLRNILTHEYPDDPSFIADSLNTAFVQAKRLLVFWESLSDYIKSKSMA